jgi:predicted Zn-dependent protease
VSQFTVSVKKHFDFASEKLLGALKAGEDATLNLQAEETLFVRFNSNRVRQNTDVEQIVLGLKLQVNGRTVEKSRTLSGNQAADAGALSRLLESCRAEAALLPADPNQVPMQNNGVSEEEFSGGLLSPTEIVAAVVGPAEGCDLAGLYAGGAVIRANRNSKGQSHWFATETFFLDYSLYNGPKAAKGVYAGSRWDPKEWEANLGRTKNMLALLAKPERGVKPGRYKTYLAPSAFNDLVNMSAWGALSASAWKQGRSPFKKLAEKETKLSPLFNMSENFALGLVPRFNSLGEVANTTLPLFEKGELKNLLVSSRTAKEYGLESNAASEGEGPRSFDVHAGAMAEKEVLSRLGTGLYLSNLHYLNWSDPVSARVTGMTRYACFWVEGGEIAGPIKDLRWDESLFDSLGTKLEALTDKAEIHPATETYSSRALGGSRTPGALIHDFTFTL